MNTKNNLTLGMGIFFLFVIISFGAIIINEKSNTIFIPKIDKKINNYIKQNYKNIYKDISYKNTIYSSLNHEYSKKVYNKNNKNLYFYIKYKNKKISSTYKKDYIMGTTLLSYLENKINKSISKSKKFTNIKITFNKSLNNYTLAVKNKLINGNLNEIKLLPIYSISCDTSVDAFNKNNLSLSIKSFYNFINSKGINPKKYTFIITNDNDISNVLEIKKLTSILINNSLDNIISDIINNDKSDIKKFNVTYKYLN